MFKDCGGCQLQHNGYIQQLKDKQKYIEKLLSYQSPFYYRNKVHAVFDRDRKGNIISGVYKEGTHKVIPVEKCVIEDQKADEIICTIRGMLKTFKITTYDEDTQNGLLRHVLIRKGFRSGQIMVVLVMASTFFPSKNNFIKALLKVHPEIYTIVLNINNKKTSMVLGDRQIVIYGKGYIEDSLCDKVFRISPKSFYQVNSVQTEILYRKAIELAQFNGSETIVDAYCGIGTIGLITSDFVKKVIGVEINADAIKDAEINKKINNIYNATFYNMDAGEFMYRLKEGNQHIDTIFMDPPRAGSDDHFLMALCSINPNKIIYISCNPVTLRRDIDFLIVNGYSTKRAIPVDMFPFTNHVETVVLMSRK